MSAKPATKKPRTYYYAFQLFGGKFVGRYTFHGPLEPVIPLRAISYTPEGIAAKRTEILTLFPTAKIVPTPIYNPESEEWETPKNVPKLN